MAERYTVLFRLPRDLYAPGWPVIVRGGVLYWDGLNRRYVAQLKLQRADPRPIRSVKALLQPRNSAGEPIGESVTTLYSAAGEDRDRSFGEKAAVPLTERLEGEIPSALRPADFTVAITEVVFRNGERWQGGGEPAPLPSARKLRDALPEEELARQFRLRYGRRAEYVPGRTADLWRCSCGAFNREDEPTCHRCGASMADQLAADLTVLAEQRDDRLALRRQRREEEEHRQALADTEKAARNSVILSSLLRAAAVLLAVAVLTWGWFGLVQPRLQYRQAEKLIEQGSYEQAAERFTDLGDFKDSAERAERALREAPLYAQATELLEQQKYGKAYEILTEIGRTDTVADSLIRRAQDALYAGDTETARTLLEGIEDRRADELRKQMDGTAAQAENQTEEPAEAEDQPAETVTPGELKPGDKLRFGVWEQDGDDANGREPITWVVLKKAGSTVELMSLNALAAKPFDETGKSASWEKCSLRAWLNGEFLEQAFTEEQRQGIEDTLNYGKKVSDKVFILSSQEVTMLSDAELRICVPSAQAIREGCAADADGICAWWLMRTGDANQGADLMDAQGKVVHPSGGANNIRFGVRPVIQIKVG